MVNSKTLIDTEFDFRQEVGGKDPVINKFKIFIFFQISYITFWPGM